MKLKIFNRIFWVSFSNLSLTLSSLVINILLTKYFPISGTTDALIAARNATEIVLKVILVGNLSSVIAPLFLERYLENKIEGIEFLFSNLKFILFIYNIVIIILFLYRIKFINFLVPGFSIENKTLVFEILFIYLIGNIFTIAISIITVMFNTLNLFHLTAVILVSSSFSQILFIFIFVHSLNIFSFPFFYLLGQVIGFIVSFLILLKKEKISFNNLFKIKFEPILTASKLLFPFLITLVFTEMNAIFYNRIISNLSEGDLTSINLAYRLFQAFNSIFTFAISTVFVFNLLPDSVNKNNKIIKNKLSSGIFNAVFLFIPIIVFIMFFAIDIVKIVFERGTFNSNNSIKIAKLLIIFFIGLIPQFIQTLFYKFILMLKKTIFVSITWSVINIFQILLFYLLANIYGIYGIALSQTISVLIAAIIFSFYLKKMKLLDFLIFFKLKYLQGFIVAFLCSYIFYFIRSIVFLNSFYLFLFLCISFIILIVMIMIAFPRIESINLIKRKLKEIFSM